MDLNTLFQTSSNPFNRLSPFLQNVIRVVLVAAVVLFSGSSLSVLAPCIMVLFWGAVTIENRTVTASTLMFAFIAGYMVLLPLSAIMATPVVLIMGPDAGGLPGVLVLLEAGLLGAGLAALSLWPQSRLRYTGGIVDFIVLGVCLGAGLEAGIGLLRGNAIAFKGVAWGFWPQLPGLLGHPETSAACSSPSLWGLGFGLLVGLARYLLGPDLGGRSLWLWLLGLVFLLLLGIGAERLAYEAKNLKGWVGVLYALDLKGRLLAYLAGLTGMIAVVVEWLLLKERQQRIGVQPFGAAFGIVWRRHARAPWPVRLSSLRAWQARRCLLRELSLGEEVRPLLKEEDRVRLEQRIRDVKQGLQEGSEQP